MPKKMTTPPSRPTPAPAALAAELRRLARGVLEGHSEVTPRALAGSMAIAAIYLENLGERYAAHDDDADAAASVEADDGDDEAPATRTRKARESSLCPKTGVRHRYKKTGNGTLKVCVCGANKGEPGPVEPPLTGAADLAPVDP